MPTSRSTKQSQPRLAQAEWDFASVPKKELIACMMWEYLRECTWHPHGRRGTCLLLQYSYDTWDARKRLNARYRNVPKTVIAAVMETKEKSLRPWQDLPAVRRNILAQPAKKRCALIPLETTRVGLWDWSYTFKSDKSATELSTWFTEFGRLLEGVDKDARNELQKSSETALHALLKSSAKYDFGAHAFDPGQSWNEKLDPDMEKNLSGVLKPPPGVDMELFSGKLFGFLTQPDFLINWAEHTKPEIKVAFAKWLDKAEPAAIKLNVTNSESREGSLRQGLRGLGIMRLLHRHTRAELVRLYAPKFNAYSDTANHEENELYDQRQRALEKFTAYVALKEDEAPRSAATKSGRSPVGKNAAIR